MSEATKLRFRIHDMDCPSCVARIENHVSKMDGVLAVGGSPVGRTLNVSVDLERTSAERVRGEVAGLGYQIQAEDEGGASAPGAPGTWTGRQARIVYAAAALFAVGLGLRVAGLRPFVFDLPLHEVRLPDLFFVASAVVGGWNFFPKGWRAARALVLDMNFLMTVAIVGAVGIGEYVEAAAIAILFALAELLESYAVDRARASVTALMELAPETAHVIREGTESIIPAADLVVSDIVAVRPGERIPADGVVRDGASAVDQSPITGESMPVDKRPGSKVFAGTINREGFLRFEVRQAVGDSTLARIVELVEAAEGRKTRSERFVDRFARWYTPAVAAAAVLVVTVPTVLLGAPFVPWFVRGLTLLVIACPCALVISTPVAVVSGVTAAARQGVLIKGGVYLEALGDVRVVALDKTGTLTFGHPEVVEVAPLGGFSRGDVLNRAAALERHSEHPLARAIVEAAGAERDGRAADTTDTALGGPDVTELTAWAAADFASIAGRGARAQLDGVEHRIGKPELVARGGELPPRELQSGGRIVVGLSAGEEVIGWIALADRARDTAAAAVEDLRAAGVEHVVMLTGDDRTTAEAVGHEIGVDEVRADLLPEDKIDAVTALEAKYGPVAMVGDGVNDAPALAAATVGVAMGAIGSDAALETADIALMGDDLTRLPYARRLAERTQRVIRQNIGAAILVKGVLAAGVPLGFVSLVTAVLVGDMGVSLAVTLNALRLGRTNGA